MKVFEIKRQSHLFELSEANKLILPPLRHNLHKPVVRNVAPPNFTEDTFTIQKGSNTHNLGKYYNLKRIRSPTTPPQKSPEPN